MSILSYLSLVSLNPLGHVSRFTDAPPWPDYKWRRGIDIRTLLFFRLKARTRESLTADGVVIPVGIFRVYQNFDQNRLFHRESGRDKLKRRRFHLGFISENVAHVTESLRPSFDYTRRPISRAYRREWCRAKRSCVNPSIPWGWRWIGSLQP